MNNYIISEGHLKDFVIKESYNEVDYEKKSTLMEVKCRIDKIPSKKWERSKKKSK